MWMKREALLAHANAMLTRGVPVALLLSVVLLFSSPSSQAQPTSRSGSSASTEVGDSTTNKAKAAVSDLTAAEMEVTALGNALTNHLQEMNRRAAAVGDSFTRHEGVLVTSTALIVVFLLILRFGRRIIARTIDRDKEAWAVASVTPLAVELAAEEKAFANFAASFRIGPKVTGGNARATEAGEVAPQKPAANPPPQEPKRRTPGEFLASAPSRVVRCRTLLKETNRMTGELPRQTVLIELSAQVQKLKEDASHPDLVLIWQVTSSLEGLLKQLGDKPGAVNASTLRTIAGCIDLLDRLCVAGSRPDLLKAPPVRFLAVDDDPISRRTISFALKRALNEPDLAEDGAAGLVLAGENSYDVIFLDIQMPGMDGFELCKKIRSGGTNQATPVVFVTCQSDFNSRAQSTLAGGCDLIGKPFLTFEVAAKALMLALGNRLNKIKQVQAQAQAQAA